MYTLFPVVTSFANPECPFCHGLAPPYPKASCLTGSFNVQYPFKELLQAVTEQCHFCAFVLAASKRIFTTTWEKEVICDAEILVIGQLTDASRPSVTTDAEGKKANP